MSQTLRQVMCEFVLSLELPADLAACVGPLDGYCLHVCVQVLLLDEQRGTSAVMGEHEVEENRSYIFLIHPPDAKPAGSQPDTITR